MATFGYTRVSTDQQVNEGESLATQQRQVIGYCMMQGLEEPQMVVEEGVSGSVPFGDRPAGQALLGRLKAGDVVVAAKLDRCFRSALDALQVAEKLKQMGVHLHLIDMGGDVVNNGMSRMFFTMIAAFAEFERERIAERTRDSVARRRAEGKQVGGTVPFGYRVDNGYLIEVPEQQAAIAQARALRAEGHSLRKISDMLCQQGHRVSHTTVSAILKS